MERQWSLVGYDYAGTLRYYRRERGVLGSKEVRSPAQTLKQFKVLRLRVCRRLVPKEVLPRELERTLAKGKAARETYEYSATLEIEGDEAEALLRDAYISVSQKSKAN